MEHTLTDHNDTNRTKQLESWTRTAYACPHLLRSMWTDDALVARVQQEERAAGAPVTPADTVLAALHSAFDGNAQPTQKKVEKTSADPLTTLCAHAHTTTMEHTLTDRNDDVRTAYDEACSMSRELSRLYLCADGDDARDALRPVDRHLGTACHALNGTKTAWGPAASFAAAADACRNAAAALDADLQDDLSALETSLRAAAS